MISMLMTAYNRECYIAEAIESVLASSYQDWELIIVDDCSTDRTVDVARRYELKDNRIKVYVNENNLGDYPNRNRASSYAKGKYLKYLDADDMIYPHGLEIMVKEMEQFPEAALGISQKVAEDSAPFPFLLSPGEAYYRQFLKKGVLDVGPSGTIIRTDVFRELGGFSGANFIGDIEMWLLIAQRYPIVKITPDLIYWRTHGNQEYKKGMTSLFYLEHGYRLSSKALRDPKCPLNSMDRERALRIIRWRFGRNLVRLAVKDRQYLKACTLYKQSDLNPSDIFKSVFFKQPYSY